MKRKGRSAALMAAGILGGTALSGPAAQAVEQLIVQRAIQSMYVDGHSVTFEAYNINGANYVKLRDIGEAVGFEVYWDGTAVQIDSGKPYTGKAPQGEQAEQINYSAETNPAVFNGNYNREVYNAAYTVLEAVKQGDLRQRESVHLESQEDRWRLETALADLANGVTLSLEAKGSGVYEVYAHKVDTAVADAATNDLIQQASKLRTDKEKVRLLNNYLCDKIEYDGKTYASINEIAAAPSPVNGSCGAFADALNYLCGRLGIPCFSEHGESHFWNAVYCDGEWSYIDVSLNDQVSGHDYLLFADSTKKQSSDPEAVRFLKELLAPGSTL